MVVCGLINIAVMLPEFRESETWLRTASARLLEAYQAQVYPDGAQIELAPGYHGVSLHNFLDALEVAQRNAMTLSPELSAGLERMFEVYLATMLPNGTMPASTTAAGVRRAAGWRRLRSVPHTAATSSIRAAAASGARRPGKHRLLPYAGWHVMRTGWGWMTAILFEAGAVRPGAPARGSARSHSPRRQKDDPHRGRHLRLR